MTPNQYLVQIVDGNDGDPNMYPHFVCNGQLEPWAYYALLVDEQTRDRWISAAAQWDAMQVEIDALRPFKLCPQFTRWRQGENYLAI